MEANFWHQVWQQRRLGFDQSEANPMLIKHFAALGLPPASRVFVPLCGRTVDIAWLLDAGVRVIGVELSETAVQQLFSGLVLAPQVTEIGRFKRYRAANLDLFVGDIFDLSRELLGATNAVYDRAALVAMPDAMRSRYSAQLAEITAQAPQLLLTLEFDQTTMPGPPFSIPAAEVVRQYGSHYGLDLLESARLPDGLKGQVDATQHAWLLRRER